MTKKCYKIYLLVYLIFVCLKFVAISLLHLRSNGIKNGCIFKIHFNFDSIQLLFPLPFRYPNNCPNGHNSEWTQSRMDAIPNEDHREWALT